MPPSPRPDRHPGRLLIALVFAVSAALAAPALVGRLIPPIPGGLAAPARAGQPGPGSTTGAGRTLSTAGAGPDGGATGARPAGQAPPDLLRRLAERPTPLDPARLDGYRWPLAAGRLTLPFKAIPGGTRINAGKLFHDGIDVASFCGDRVLAAHDGVVLAAGRHFDASMGWLGDLAPYFALLDRKHMWPDLPNVVVIDDGNGYRSMYAHFSRVSVKVGQHVTAGQVIGAEGMTGHASGCHVHYGLYSPLETATFGVREDILAHLKLPPFEVARIDPLLVLPDGATALRTRHVPHAAPAGPSPAPGGTAPTARLD